MPNANCVHGTFLKTALVFAIVAVAGWSSSTVSAAVKYTVKDGAIAKPLTGKKGDAVKGRATSINRKKGNCLSCHKMPIPEQDYHGNWGPDLKGVGSRYSEGEIRMRLVNPKVVNDATSMPAFYRTASEGLHRVQKKWKGKTILSATQIEDIVAYLVTLRDDTPFAKAFGWAKKANLKSFEWRGKLYSTSTK